MKETYVMTPDGDLEITLEAETPEDAAELKRLALEAVTQGLPDGEEIELWASPESESNDV